jgi:hypothetical protein
MPLPESSGDSRNIGMLYKKRGRRFNPPPTYFTVTVNELDKLQLAILRKTLKARVSRSGRSKGLTHVEFDNFDPLGGGNGDRSVGGAGININDLLDLTHQRIDASEKSASLVTANDDRPY